MTKWLGLVVLVTACSAARSHRTSSVEVPQSTASASNNTAARYSPQIDAVMEAWDREDSPGCAVAVIQDRELVHAAGYGMADLEHAVPITPDTVFEIGSTSKQFTASAVLLAAADGTLRLDDDVRMHVPALPQLGATPVTLRHLLHHTGGLRDYGMLMVLGGSRLDGIVTVRQTLDMITRQRGFDFVPGTQFQYSNTGYVLLAQAVEHATGQSLATYLHAKVFGPLDMQSTQVLDDRRRIIPGRAIGYAPDNEGWAIEMSGWELTGPGSVMSTVVDLAKWDANFYEPTVGGAALVDGLQTRGSLADGTSLDYAAGLFHGHYRGQPTVWHAGGWAGYRAQFERFVALNTSIVVLCNATSARPDLLAHEIADVVLHNHLRDEPDSDIAVFPTIQPAVDQSDAQLDTWVAMYREVSTGELMAVERTDEALAIVTRGEHIALVPTGPRTFRLDPDPVVLEFDGTPPRRTLVVKGPAFEENFVETELLHPTAEQLAALAGRYRSDEIGTEWTLSVSGRTLVVTGPPFDEPAPLATAIEDEYSAEILGAAFRFIRDGRGAVTRFELGLNNMRGIRFERVASSP